MYVEHIKIQFQTFEHPANELKLQRGRRGSFHLGRDCIYCQTKYIVEL